MSSLLQGRLPVSIHFSCDRKMNTFCPNLRAAPSTFLIPCAHFSGSYAMCLGVGRGQLGIPLLEPNPTKIQSCLAILDHPRPYFTRDLMARAQKSTEHYGKKLRLNRVFLEDLSSGQWWCYYHYALWEKQTAVGPGTQWPHTTLKTLERFSFMEYNSVENESRRHSLPWQLRGHARWRQ